MNCRQVIPGLVLLWAFSAGPRLLAQGECQPPPLPPVTPGVNIFTEQQEVDLGDAAAEHIQGDFQVIDADINDYLRQVGERIVKHIPPTHFRFQFFLVDLPDVNAFALPGGRVYVTRKLVAFVRNEDELAGVLGHEIGHIISHHTAIDMTRTFQAVLGVTAVRERADIFDKYNQLMDNWRRKPKSFQRNERASQDQQVAADRIGLYAATAAGYSTQAYLEFSERRLQESGKASNWLSSLFGFVKPERERMHDLLSGASALPPACVERRAAGASEDFQQWQAAVIGYSGFGHRENLHAVLMKRELKPPLRSDISLLKFSPDGKYILAQDDSSIFVLSHEPFKLLFRIDAPDAIHPQFTPDSQKIVFHTSGLRVEWWSIADEQRVGVYELAVLEACRGPLLSPDGKTLACVTRDFALTLRDVPTGAQICEKKSFYQISLTDFLLLALFPDRPGLPGVHAAFSPDGRYFVAAHSGRRGGFGALSMMQSLPDDQFLAFDLVRRTPVSLPGSIKRLLPMGFTFQGPDRLVGVNRENPKKSGVVRFPSGEAIGEFLLGDQELSAAGRGDYVLLRPIQDFPVGVMNLTSKKIVLVNKTAALDLYDGQYVREAGNGELALADVKTRNLVAHVPMPDSPLDSVRASVLTPDLHWLAVSGKSRGAVWNLATGERMYHMRGFRGAFIEQGQVLYADFPKEVKTDRQIGKFSLLQPREAPGPVLKEPRTTMVGRFLWTIKPESKSQYGGRDVTLEVRDVCSGDLLWSRRFEKEAPEVSVQADEGTMVLSWPTWSDAAKEEVKNDPRFQGELAALAKDRNNYFLQIYEAQSGKVLGSLLVDTGKGSFDIRRVFAAGDWVVVSDSTNRVLLYSLSHGDQKGKVFGHHPVIARNSGLLSVENERGQIIVYDLASLQKRDEFDFSYPISLARFAADGKRLFVLTADQTAYILDVSSLAARQQ